MSLRAFYNMYTQKTHFVFENELEKLPDLGSKGLHDVYIPLPPNPTVILATNVYMTEQPRLDSVWSMYELDRQLNIEAEQDRIDKMFQEASKEF